MFKKFSSVFLLLLIGLTLISCKPRKDYSNLKNATPPDVSYMKGDYELDFNDMNSYVIDYLQSETMPFFFIKNNKNGVLKGDNNTKTIELFCTCLNGTSQNDLDLFISMALLGIAYNASEQDFRFKPPKSNDGFYVDFGNVFNVYNLKIDAKDESGNVIRNDFIQATNRMPDGIRPEYINID